IVNISTSSPTLSPADPRRVRSGDSAHHQSEILLKTNAGVPSRSPAQARLCASRSRAARVKSMKARARRSIVAAHAGEDPPPHAQIE
ncbi:hypothetical protein JYU34_015555, partial [Plutella xylostella]